MFRTLSKQPANRPIEFGHLYLKSGVRACNRPSFPSIPRRFKCTIKQDHPFIRVSEEVRHALDHGKPVVALESTIYTHGFPNPANVELAIHLQDCVRTHGGIPATIGVLRGQARIGFSSSELEELTRPDPHDAALKLSRRDLAYICAMGLQGRPCRGGTTVSGTMLLAHLCGIKVFATGGLGGVHRGGENSMDISADLTELGRTPVAVISSGCKSFLDIPRTLEYLETQGVTVATFADGRTGKCKLPAFWTRESDTTSPLTIRDEADAAALIYAQSQLPIETGILLASPIAEEHSIAQEEIESSIRQAVNEASQTCTAGSENTPFVLKRLRALTNGKTVKANEMLVEANVIRGTKVAVELENLVASRQPRPRRAVSSSLVSLPSQIKEPCLTATENVATGTSACGNHGMILEELNTPNETSLRPDIIVAGAVALDTICDVEAQTSSLDKACSTRVPVLGTSNPSHIRQTLGGVGLNIATAARYAGASVSICSRVGRDIAGTVIMEGLSSRGIERRGVIQDQTTSSSAQYIAVNDTQKDLVLGLADMSILTDHNADTIEQRASWQTQVAQTRPKWLACDTNWDAEQLRLWISWAKESGAKIAVEPVSKTKSIRIIEALVAQRRISESSVQSILDLATPNAMELASMHDAASHSGLFDSNLWYATMDAMGLSNVETRTRLSELTSTNMVAEGLPQQMMKLLPFIRCICVTLGSQGVLLAQLLSHRDRKHKSDSIAPFLVSPPSQRTLSADKEPAPLVYLRYFPTSQVLTSDMISNVNGAGDTFLGYILAKMCQSEGPAQIEDIIHGAQVASLLTLQSSESVSARIRDMS